MADNKNTPGLRIFVNRSLHLEKIKFYGFDMDYTLAVYKSPRYESMSFNLLKERLVDVGYPASIREFEYDPSFPVRGLWFDKCYGNLLKMDAYGNILVCVHGFKFLKPQEIGELYPNKFLALDDTRMYVLNTLFNLPETYMLACIIDYFTSSNNYKREKEGVRSGELYMSYKSIFQDVRSAVDWLHYHGALKTETIKNLDLYVHKDERLPLLLERIRAHGGKTVLITNSDYNYTDKIMTYLVDYSSQNGVKKDWTSYFDHIVVDAQKPLFFGDGTTLRQVDRETGSLKLGDHQGELLQGHVYSGGSSDVLAHLIGAKGKDVLYVGDHIFGDILKSKKKRGWRTFLVIPELSEELIVWTDRSQLYNQIENLERVLAAIYKNLDSSTDEKPDITKIQQSLRDVVHKLDMSYGILGSLFRSGSRQTFFASQVQRYADVYSSTFLNLLHYPFCYMYRAPPMLMPHESTVKHQTGSGETGIAPSFTRARSYEEVACMSSPTKRPRQVTSPSKKQVPHLRADLPQKVTHHHDEGDDSPDDDSSSHTSEKSEEC
ncbi:cytosolic purine 5'-nucleotidase-like isoform X2 [Gigantopelta aegis]|uniref:cytosolic purine 5'-nucleotidase-like isoform X2 n=1 Tax=Gigantopelta aegis TaxID=1735272 RepID=UPI001B888D35|nr:cytosolic purine 5'-nucleotidase-like isoform X2 [Gigantopelta aegis]